MEHYSGWRPDTQTIDALKGEGLWNNDWDASLELLRRHGCKEPVGSNGLPARDELIQVFSRFYFGQTPDGDPAEWDGLICNEPLLVQRSFFEALSSRGARWGFVSGAEPPSARFLLSERLKLACPPLVAMGDAPDKPDPTGLLSLAASILEGPLGPHQPVVAYLGDTVADVQTVVRARQRCPQQAFVSLAVAPPHLHQAGQEKRRESYERQLKTAGADFVLTQTSEAIAWVDQL